jgi:hypothetical protein
MGKGKGKGKGKRPASPSRSIERRDGLEDNERRSQWCLDKEEEMKRGKGENENNGGTTATTEPVQTKVTRKRVGKTGTAEQIINNSRNSR